MDSVEKRIEKAIQLSGLRYRNEFAKLIGVTPDALKKWEKRGKISEKGAFKIASMIPISQTYLLTGEGDPELKPSGISNYDHPVRKEELLENFERLDDRDKKAVYHIIRRLAESSDDGFTAFE